jgi:hypothetical protein
LHGGRVSEEGCKQAGRDACPQGQSSTEAAEFGLGKEEVLRDLLNFTGADAGCANTEAATCAIDQCADRLQIQIPPTLRYVVCVADAITELGTATT